MHTDLGQRVGSLVTEFRRDPPRGAGAAAAPGGQQWGAPAGAGPVATPGPVAEAADALDALSLEELQELHNDDAVAFLAFFRELPQIKAAEAEEKRLAVRAGRVAAGRRLGC